MQIGTLKVLEFHMSSTREGSALHFTLRKSTKFLAKFKIHSTFYMVS